MILDVCSAPEVLETMRVIKIILTALRIAVPILLIFFGIKTFLEALKDADNKKATSKALTMCIAAICVFLVPTFINLVLSMVGGGYENCLENATSEGISKAYYNTASRYVDVAGETLNKSNLTLAERYLKNVDESDRGALNDKISTISDYIDIATEIDHLTSKNYSKNIQSIKDAIDGIPDEEVKEKLNQRLEDKLKSISTVASKYPINPDDNLYKNLTYMKNITLSQVLINNGSSIDELNEEIYNAVVSAGVGTREAVVSAAMTLIGRVAECGYKIPYYWGGKRRDFGADGTWGPHRYNSICNSQTPGSGAEYCLKNLSNWGMDCSGFVNWAVVNGIQQKLSQSETNNGQTQIYGKEIRLNSSTANSAVCQIADAIVHTGHIMLVVGLDDENKRYIIAEESNGLALSSVPYDGGSKYANYCRKLDDNYTN